MEQETHMNHRPNQLIRLAVAGAMGLLASVSWTQESLTATEVLRIKWVNPPAGAPAGVRHGTFHSACMDTMVGYNIYLPPAYEADPGRHFPVVYFLHGSTGNESRSIRLATYLHAAIASGTVPPMLMVFANGGRNSGYVDSVDGTVRPETMIVEELIPHIDATYRTIARRAGRAIQGFSMGGGGALRIGAKFPDLFSSVVVYGAGGVREFDDFPDVNESDDVEKAKRKLPLRKAILGDDLAYWRETSTWHLLGKNRDRIAGRLPIRIAIGTEDFSLEGAKGARDRLAELKIAYEFELVQGPDHNIYKLYDHVGLDGFLFHAKHFGDETAK
jgi:S-formylglutathione hydrolase FrmB